MVTVKKLTVTPSIIQDDGILTPADNTGRPEEVTVRTTEEETIPYAEFGGLGQDVSARRVDAERRRAEAYDRWQKRLKEADDTTLAFAQRLVPSEDMRRKERSLRRIAAAQSFGELVGQIFGGINNFGRRGQGYVLPAQGLGTKTLERSERLYDQGIRADREYRSRMAGILAELSKERTRRAEREYRVADDDLERIYRTEDSVLRQGVADQYRREQERMRQQGRADMERMRQQNRERYEKMRQQNRIGLKDHASALSKPDDDVARVKTLLLPKTRKTERRDPGGALEYSTTSPATSYSKQADAAATVLARQVVPMQKRYGLSDYDIVELQRTIEEVPTVGADWTMIGKALERGIGVDDIVQYIRANK